MQAIEKMLEECRAEIALGAEERALVATWAPHLEREVEAAARRYYDHLKTTDVGRLLTDDRIDRLLAARVDHWRLLLHGDFAAAASDYAERFGRRLLDAGFPMRIFVVATNWFVVELGRIVDETAEIPPAVRPDLRTALTKFAFLDLALAHATHEVTYID